MTKTVIGVLHPGEMGAAVGRCLTGRGHTVLWAPAGRGPDTAARAAAAGLADAGTVEAVAGRAEVILSVCPPHAAMDSEQGWPHRGVPGVVPRVNTAGQGEAVSWQRAGIAAPAVS